MSEKGKSGFRKLVELSDREIRKQLEEDFYYVSESRINNMLHCLESGAEKIQSLEAQLTEAREEFKELQQVNLTNFERAEKAEADRDMAEAELVGVATQCKINEQENKRLKNIVKDAVLQLKLSSHPHCRTAVFQLEQALKESKDE